MNTTNSQVTEQARELLAKAVTLGLTYVKSRSAPWSHTVQEEDEKTILAAIAALTARTEARCPRCDSPSDASAWHTCAPPAAERMVRVAQLSVGHQSVDACKLMNKELTDDQARKILGIGIHDLYARPQPAQGDGSKYQHKWDGDGERCSLCGDKDWMGGECSGPPPAPADGGKK